ncbi:MAG: putative ABC transporter permease, partial [Pseudoflavonifractor sp.]
MAWFSNFLIYSFLGFLLEVLFARVTRSSKRDRKCRRFLPLCPVYGLGAMLILLLPAQVRGSPWLLFLWGGAAATAAEYLLGLFYERVAGVKFWDYSHLPLNVGGKICLLF